MNEVAEKHRFLLEELRKKEAELREARDLLELIRSEFDFTCHYQDFSNEIYDKLRDFKHYVY